jgi:hypothetical protein
MQNQIVSDEGMTENPLFGAYNACSNLFNEDTLDEGIAKTQDLLSEAKQVDLKSPHLCVYLLHFSASVSSHPSYEEPSSAGSTFLSYEADTGREEAVLLWYLVRRRQCKSKVPHAPMLSSQR